MTQTSAIERRFPSDPLKPFIAEYLFRKIALPQGYSVIKAMPLRLISSIDFFLGDEYETTDCTSGDTIPFSRCTIRGPRTYRKNLITISSGNFTSFSIRFKPVGLYGLLGIPAYQFSDESMDATTIHARLFDEITSRLMHCNTIDECIGTAEPYLQQLSAKAHARRSPAVEQLTLMINEEKVPAPIKTLQQKIYLSPRQLERNFIKEIGITPKMYSRMVRFTNLLNYKEKYNNSKWASIAYEFDYADQTHLVKDFQQFLGVSPSNFVPDNFAF